METTHQSPVATLESNLRVLIVEDSRIEAELTVNLLRKSGYTVFHQRVEIEEELITALEEHDWDIVISDYQMPDFDGARALKIFQKYELDIPFILVSGKIGEEAAVDLMKMGAHDYIMKGNTARLIPAIKSQLQDAEIRRANLRLQKRIKESEARYRGFFQNARIGIFRCSDHGVLLDSNMHMAGIFGYSSPTEFMKSVETIIPEIFDQDSYNARPVHLFELAKKQTQVEAIFHHRDGTLLETKISVWAIQEDPDKPVYLEGVVEDITEQKRIERKLREMEELHESLIDLASNL